jgi:hypothetical protein
MALQLNRMLRPYAAIDSEFDLGKAHPNLIVVIVNWRPFSQAP